MPETVAQAGRNPRGVTKLGPRAAADRASEEPVVARGVRLVGVYTVERGVAGRGDARRVGVFLATGDPVAPRSALVQMGLYLFDYYVPWVILMAIVIGAAITGWALWRR